MACFAAAGVAWSGGAAGPGPAVVPTIETTPVPDGGDAADDAAVWVHPTDPAPTAAPGRMLKNSFFG